MPPARPAPRALSSLHAQLSSIPNSGPKRDNTNSTHQTAPLGTLHTTEPSAGLYTGSMAGQGTILRSPTAANGIINRFLRRKSKRAAAPSVNEEGLPVGHSGGPRGPCACALSAAHAGSRRRAVEAAAAGEKSAQRTPLRDRKSAAGQSDERGSCY